MTNYIVTEEKRGIKQEHYLLIKKKHRIQNKKKGKKSLGSEPSNYEMVTVIIQEVIHDNNTENKMNLKCSASPFVYSSPTPTLPQSFPAEGNRRPPPMPALQHLLSRHSLCSCLSCNPMGN